jgi:hypothetical protein
VKPRRKIERFLVTPHAIENPDGVESGHSAKDLIARGRCDCDELWKRTFNVLQTSKSKTRECKAWIGIRGGRFREERCECIAAMRKPIDLSERHCGLTGLRCATLDQARQSRDGIVDTPKPLLDQRAPEIRLRVERREFERHRQISIRVHKPPEVEMRITAPNPTGK